MAQTKKRHIHIPHISKEINRIGVKSKSTNKPICKHSKSLLVIKHLVIVAVLQKNIYGLKKKKKKEAGKAG